MVVVLFITGRKFKISFSVKSAKWGGEFEHDKVMIFKRILDNDGYGYLPREGKFKSPKAGLYSFELNMKAKIPRVGEPHCALVVNGKEKLYLSGFEVFRQKMIKLRKGDMVWVKLKRGATIVQKDAWFDGVLMYADKPENPGDRGYSDNGYGYE